VQECECVMIAAFPVLGEAAAAIEPGDGAFDNPSLWLNNKALGIIRAFDDLDHEAARRLGQAISEDRSRIGAIGEQLAQERELPEQRGQHEDASVAALNIDGSHQRVQHQAQRVDQDVTLLALDQFAGIKAVWVDARAPFPRFSRSGYRSRRPSDLPRGPPARGI